MKSDKIKESLEQRVIKNDEKYLQYLHDNNLQHTYVPTISIFNNIRKAVNFVVKNFSHHIDFSYFLLFYKVFDKILSNKHI